MDWERRAALELRADPEGRTLSGVAIRYGDTARLPFGLEKFEAGAFVDLSNVRLDVQHDRGRIIARTGAGLILTDSPEALTFEATLPETREADDTLRLVRADILRGASIEFRAMRERLERRTRIVSRALLGAVSVVDDPAYKLSAIQARWNAPETRRPRVSWWLL